MAELVSQAEFARIKGMTRGWVTKLKQSGRLVINNDGLVDVEKSNQLIEQTANPNRQDVADRHKSNRQQDHTPAMEFNTTQAGATLQASRAVKEKFSALKAKAEYEEYMGNLVNVSEVQHAVADVVMTLRQVIENIPHRVAPELVHKDIDFIRSRLREELYDGLNQMQKN